MAKELDIGGPQTAVAEPKTESSSLVQFKQELASMSYADQLVAIQPDLPVQFTGGSIAGGASVHSIAGEGVSGAGGSLPHLDAIQQSFGGHDLSSVQSHVGGKAAEATTALGAEAYATGNSIAFKESPSLHTAAHEAAHIVQQRAGVSLPGGVGSVGDSYEKQADAVADRVVSGQSAADLLGTVSDGSSSAVQKVTTPGGGKPTTDADYKAVPDFNTFKKRCKDHLGMDEATALGKWKTAVDGLDVAQDKWDALGGNWAAMTSWIDSAGRAPFEALGRSMLPDLDPDAQYGLWSGGDPAQNYAASKCTILETTKLGLIFNKLDIAGETKWGINQAIWRGLSASYAEKLAVCKKPIQVFQRKEGEIFIKVELPALIEARRDLGKAAPTLDYIALTMPDRFGYDSTRDHRVMSNQAWQEKWTALMGVTEAKKRFPVIYKYPKASDLTGTSKGNNPAAAEAAILANNTAVNTLYQTEYDRLYTVNINTDGEEKLTSLIGIGPALSAAIITERARSPFATVADIARVSGIATKVQTDNAGRITV